MKPINATINEVIEKGGYRGDEADKIMRDFIEAVEDGGWTFISKHESDRMLRAMYGHYKIRRAANEMFQAHLGLRAQGAAAASGKQMTAWQAVLKGRSDAE